MPSININSSVNVMRDYFTNDFKNLFAMTYFTKIESFLNQLDIDTVIPTAVGSTLISVIDGFGRAVRFEGANFGPITSITNLTQSFADFRSAVEALNGSATASLNRVVLTDATGVLAELTISPTVWTLSSGADRVTITGNLPTTLTQVNNAVGELYDLNLEKFKTTYNPNQSVLSEFNISSVVATSNNVEQARLTYTTSGITVTAGNYEASLTGTLPARMSDYAQLAVLDQQGVGTSAYQVASFAIKNRITGELVATASGTPTDLLGLGDYLGTFGTAANDSFASALIDQVFEIDLGAGNDVATIWEDTVAVANFTNASAFVYPELNSVIGGAGSDTVSYIHANAGIRLGLTDATPLNQPFFPYPTLSGFGAASALIAQVSQATGSTYGVLASNNNTQFYVLRDVENIGGTLFSDSLLGNAQANVLYGYIGRDSLSGQSGNDVLVGDGPLSLTANAQQIKRLYITTLDRGPDDGGWINWATQRDGGQTLESIATGFIGSQEFQNKYSGLDNAAFVRQLYRNVLDREPDQAGFNTQLNALNSGALTRSQLVVNFSESQELKNGMAIDLHASQIYRLYGATLARTPDAGGFEYWTDRLGNGQGLVDIAGGFVGSTEFQTRFPGQDPTSFVTLLYNNVLGRAPDASGLSYWTGQLNTNAQTRTQVVIGFSESQEYINSTRIGTDAFMRNTMSAWTDTLVGGAGNDSLTGGRGSDRFVFTASEGGNDVIYGFESYDSLRMIGFGYANSTAALAAMAQQGSNVVLNYSGGSITFADTQLSVLQSMTAQGWTFA